ncbi:MAG: S8 family serine peptidase [Dehalococcoidales bacterium]|nr:MAG: S8 family serine peptidase [Dehalococcoidales bacterium]
MKLFNVASPVVMVVGLLIASAGVTEGVLSADDFSLSGQSASAQPEAQATVGTGVSAISNDVLDDVSIAPPVSTGYEDPYLDLQWALEQLPTALLSQPGTDNEGVLVAVLDTGVDLDHEDLGGRVVVSMNFTSSPMVGDISGHGTHVAGIIAASSNNGTGIAGLAPASRIMSIKVANDGGRTEAKAMAEGIIWAVENGASVINISAEFSEPSLDLEEAINYAWEQGALVIAAAGNQGNQLPVYPACYENCIAVAASSPDGTLAPLSNYGDWVDVVAPGFEIYSTLPDDSYGYKSGTSFAAAHVSGLAASLFPLTTDTNGNGRVNDEVRAMIESSLPRTALN